MSGPGRFLQAVTLRDEARARASGRSGARAFLFRSRVRYNLALRKDT